MMMAIRSGKKRNKQMSKKEEANEEKNMNKKKKRTQEGQKCILNLFSIQNKAKVGVLKKFLID